MKVSSGRKLVFLKQKILESLFSFKNITNSLNLETQKMYGYKEYFEVFK